MANTCPWQPCAFPGLLRGLKRVFVLLQRWCGMRDPGPHSLVGGREGTRKVGEGSDQASVSPLKSFKVTWSNFKARLS